MEEKDTWVEDIAGIFGLDVETVQLLESYLLKIIEVNKKKSILPELKLWNRAGFSIWRILLQDFRN